MVRDGRGGVMTEYGLLLVLVAVAAIAAMQLVGLEILDLFADSQSDFAEAGDRGALAE